MHNHELYRPSDDKEYMSERQLSYFEKKLVQWKQELLSASMAARDGLKQTWVKAPDMFDVAAHNTGLAVDVKDMERTRHTLMLIDRALTRINTGEYGYCELTGEEIGIRRLQAHPAALYSIEGQEMLEQNARMKGQYRNPALSL